MVFLLISTNLNLRTPKNQTMKSLFRFKRFIFTWLVVGMSTTPSLANAARSGAAKEYAIDSTKQWVLPSSALPFSDVLYWVLKNHPVLKQANNYLPIAKAELLASRGAFDPSVSIYRSEKNEGSNKFYRNQNLDVYIPNYFGGGISISNPFNKTQSGESGSLSLGAELPY